MGNTIKKEIKEGIAVEGIQSQAQIINAATGTERISLDNGLVIILKILLLPDNIPKMRPKNTAKTKPQTICHNELPTACQNIGSDILTANSFTVSIGKGILNKSRVLAIFAAICHSSTQNITDTAEADIFFRLSFIIEIISR